VTNERRPVSWAWYGFYLVLLVGGVVGSLAAGYQGDVFWLVVGWGIGLGVLTRIFGLRPPR
jgi:hypothetical protein